MCIRINTIFYLAAGQESTLVFCEDSPILSLALDTSGATDSLWVATTDTSINKWSVDSNLMVEEGNGLVSGEESEEEVVVTNIDEPTPFFTKPVATLPGEFFFFCLHISQILSLP